MLDLRGRAAGGSDFEGLESSIQQTPIATVVTKPSLSDNPIVAVNDAFCELTGYARHEVLGRNCRFLSGPASDAGARAALAAAVFSAHPALVEIDNYRRDGSLFRNAVMIAPVRDPTGAVAYFIGSQMELSFPREGGVSRATKASELVSLLTTRQREVLDHVVRGDRNKQIAKVLGIDEKTVKMHRVRLLSKLGAITTADAIRIGVEAGLPLSDPG